MNPLGYRVSNFYHKALNPATIPVIIDNKLFILTEQLSRHVVDTKLSFLIPYPPTNDGTWIYPEYLQPNFQFQPNPNFQSQPYQQMFNPTPGNVEQQLLLERMQAQFVIDLMNANANQQLINQSLSNNGVTAAAQPRIFYDASTHTYDLMQPNDVNMNFQVLLSVPKAKPLNSKTETVKPSIYCQRRRSGKVLLVCEICSKKFERPSLLKRHSRVHTGERPHHCVVCDKRFSTSSSLNTHSRIHSGEKPHRCLVCGKSFTASSNLYYHRMTHYKNKPHKCMLCSKSFSTPGDLRGHYYKHTGQWPFTCKCGKGFSKKTTLRAHELLH